MTSQYQKGWLAGLRFAADAARSFPDAAVGRVDDNARRHLLSFSEGLALGASMREAEWAAAE